MHPGTSKNRKLRPPLFPRRGEGHMLEPRKSRSPGRSHSCRGSTRPELQEGNGGRNVLNSPSFQPQISCQGLALVKAGGQGSLRYAVHGSASQGTENGRQWILGIGIQKIKQHNNNFIWTSPSPRKHHSPLHLSLLAPSPKFCLSSSVFPSRAPCIQCPPSPATPTFMSRVGENAVSPRIPFAVTGFFPI